MHKVLPRLMIGHINNSFNDISLFLSDVKQLIKAKKKLNYSE